MKRKSNFRHPVRVSNLFSKVLPENYRQQSATLAHYQQFFQQQDSDAVFQMVQVLNVSDECLTLALPSPALVNYLRLHSEQITAQIAEQFGHIPRLKIVAQPEAEQARAEKSKLKPPRHFDEPVCERVKKSASSLDDDALRDAMISLSKAISRKPGQ